MDPVNNLKAHRLISFKGALVNCIVLNVIGVESNKLHTFTFVTVLEYTVHYNGTFFEYNEILILLFDIYLYKCLICATSEICAFHN